MSGGVFAGTKSPNQIGYSASVKPSSLVVGTSGKAAVRVAPLTASARSLPSRTCGPTSAGGPKKKSTRPAITSDIASAPPLNGTWSASMPALIRNRSALRCVAVPTPTDENVSAPGRALAAATRSLAVLKLLPGETTSTFGEIPKGMTAAKSRAGS
jgi:hypothetical protein